MYIMINKFMSIGLFPNLIWQKKMMSRCLATTASDPVNYINKYLFSAPNEIIDKNKSGTSYQPKAFGRACLFEIFNISLDLNFLDKLYYLGLFS